VLPLGRAISYQIAMTVTLQYLKEIGLPIGPACMPAPAQPSESVTSDKALAPAAAPAAALPSASAPMTPEEEKLAEAMCRPLPLRDPGSEVSVVSFNMLLKGFDLKPYYPSVPAELRAWPHRKSQLQRVILGVDSDIYCMQEVEAVSFPEEFAFLADAGYESVAPKDDSKGKRPDMAKTAIFYKSSRLEKLWQEHRSRLVIAAFRHLLSDRILYVVSCHLEGAPWQVATRFTQMQNALDSIRKHQRQQGIEPASCALIFAGDFNEGEDGAVCHCLRDGALSSSFRHPAYPEVEVIKEDFKHDFQLSDLYAPISASLGARRPPTFCAPEEETGPAFAAIDFVFYSHGSLLPTAVRLPFTEEQLRATDGVGVPSAWHFSDHVPIGGVFRFVACGSAAKPVVAC